MDTNFSNTWKGLGIDLPDFTTWLSENSNNFSTENCAKMSYLSWLYKQRIDYVSSSLIGESCPFAKEVRLACDQLSITGDSFYADQLISGKRLAIGLHPDYVKETNCY